MLPSSVSSTPMSLVTKEEKACDYLYPSESTSDDAFVTQSDRTLIVDWMYSIVDGCQLDLGTVGMAMGMVDRFLSKPSQSAQDTLRDRKQFQLVAIAALSLCLKADKRTTPGSKLLARVSGPMYSIKEIEDAEADLQEGLSSGHQAPTSLQMARHFLSLAFPEVISLEESRLCCILDDVRFQLEYAVRDYYFSLQYPRTVAMAAILNALDEVTGQDRQVMCRVFPPVVNEHFPSRAEVTDLLAAKNRLREVMERDTLADEETGVVPERIMQACE
jgi:hypothetical protein